MTKLDRLGRDAVDVLQTIRDLETRKVRVIVLQLGSTDLTSAAGKLLVSKLAAVAEMERDLLIERTHAGLARADAHGKALGRRPLTTPEQKEEIRTRLAEGETVSSVARSLGCSRATVINIREASV